jgi:purine-cytosine permease-like protein
LVAATGYTSAGATGRKWMVRFAIADSIAYTAYILIGAILPIKFLVTYEGFMAFIGANFLLMFFMNIRYYRVHHDALNKKLIQVWLGFLLVNIGYFAFLFGGFGASLYAASGLWFNENDALHVLLIAWSAFIYFAFRDENMDVSAD